MKPGHSSILIFGHDEHLLTTRQWVLQSRGYRVTTVSTLNQLDSIAQTPPVKLLVLCHSLDASEAETAMAHATLRWPGVLNLELVSDGRGAPAGILGQLLHTMDGPSKLVSLVDGLIGANSSQSSNAA